MTFGDYGKTWIEGRPGAPTTRDTYGRHLRNHMNPTFGRRRLRSIKSSEVQGWVTGLVRDKGLAPSTAETVFKIFASILRAAKNDGHLSESPCAGIRLPEVLRTQIRLLNSQSILSLASAMPERYRALVLVAGGEGLRQGEAFGLCLDSVQFLERRLKVQRQISLEGASRPILTARLKTRSSRRSIPLETPVAEALARHIDEFSPHPESGALFTAPRGGYIKRGTFNEDVWKPAIGRAGLASDTTFHDLRHSYASLLIAGGVNMKELSTWMGHSTISETADTYGHLYPEADDRARLAIDLALASPAERLEIAT